MNCSRDIYLRFWNEKYQVTQEDEKHFDAFTGVLDELEKAAPAARSVPYLPRPSRSVSGWWRRCAGRNRRRIFAGGARADNGGASAEYGGGAGVFREAAAPVVGGYGAT